MYNISCLGARVSVSQLLEPKAILDVLDERIPKYFLERIHRALDVGLLLGPLYQYRRFT